jgi:hypothetical protein
MFLDIKRSFRPLASIVAVAMSTAACNSDTTAPATQMLLDVTVTLTQGVDCNMGGVSVDLTGQAGPTVTIVAVGGSNMRPQFTLYAPDYETQLGGSTADGDGRAKLVFTLSQSGTHHLTLCDANGAAGALKVTVTQPRAG